MNTMVVAIVLLPGVFGGLTLLMLARMRRNGKRRRTREPGKGPSHWDTHVGPTRGQESDEGLW